MKASRFARAAALLAATGIVIGQTPSGVAPSFVIDQRQRVGIGKWQGRLIMRNGLDNAGEAGLAVFDGKSQNAWNVRLDIPGATRIIISDAAFRPVDGTLVVTATTQTVSGEKAALLCFADATGKTTLTHRLNPFLGQLVTVSSDGRIWVFGQNIADNIEDAVLHDAYVFQVFNADGTLATSHTLASTVSPKKIIPIGESRSGMSRLISSGDRVGLYVARLNQWSEYANTDGRLLGKWVIPFPTVKVDGIDYSLTPAGVALTASNRLFGYFWNKQAPRFKGLGYYEFDRVSGIWKSVSEMNLGKYSMLWGAEGEKLLVSTGSPSGMDGYLWVSPPSK